ncbi:MAG: AfsR/SARP family transcriptional regulator, partial [Trebonia sp.]
MLGPLEVWSGDDWASIGAAKWRSLLACLLLKAGQIVPTETLIDELWGDNPPPTATNLVSIYVLRLRRAIGDAEGHVLVHRRPGYQLKIVDGDTDLHQFESLVADGRDTLLAGDAESAAALLAKAEASWRGAFLADVPPSAFVSTEAERTLELRLAATELRIRAELECRRNAEAVPELRSLVTVYPLREGLWLLLMHALNGAGRHAEALDAYGQAREVIAEELGVDPGAELQRLYGELLAADASAAQPPATRSSRPAGPAPEAPALATTGQEAVAEGAAGRTPAGRTPAGRETADDAEEALPEDVPGTIAIGAFGDESGADAAGVP